MRPWFACILFLGLAALPSTVQAQYPNPGTNYAPPSGYRAPYPYYQQPQYPAWGYYYAQPAPRYVPNYPGYWQGMPPPGMEMSGPRPVQMQPGDVGESQRIYNAVPQVVPSVPTAPEPAAPVSEPAFRPGSKGILGAPSRAEPSLQPSAEPPATLPAPTAPTVGKEPTAPPIQSLPPALALPNTDEPKKCRLVIFGELLYWNVHGADVPFAQPFDGIDPIFSVPRGAVATVSPTFQTGFRVGGEAGVSDAFWVAGTFTYFYTHRDAETKASNGLVLHNFLAFPNTANSAVDSLTSKADYKIRLLMADIDGKGYIINNDCLSLNWLAGGRYAHLDQDFFNTFQVTGATTIDSKISYDGFGPRLGLDGQYRLKCGVYGYAHGVLDVLFGQFRGSYEERNVFTGLVGLTSINANRVVPVLELELGAGWQSPKGHIHISGGYYVGSWYNTMTTTSLASAIGNVNFTTNGNNFRDNIVFDGFVLRCEFRY